MSKETTRRQYPSVMKPWLRYYADDVTSVSLPKRTVYELMREHNAKILHRTALICDDREISYGDLFAKIEHAAASFYSLGIRAGDIVVICSYTIPEVVCSFYALNRLGAVCSFLDPRANDDRLLHYIKETQSRIALVWEEQVPRFKAFQKQGVLDTIIILPNAAYETDRSFPEPKDRTMGEPLLTWSDLSVIASHNSPGVFPYQKDYPAVILFTGGTTGVPKGVILSNDALNTITLEYDTCGIEYEVGHRYFNIMPPFVASGMICGINMILGLGLTSILVPGREPNRVAELYLKYRPEHVLAVPAYYEKLFQTTEFQNADLSFIKTIATGGDELLPEIELKLNIFLRTHRCSTEIGKGYGLTELAFAVTTTRTGVNKTGSVGIPLPLTTISVRDPITREELPFGSEGEVCISSSSAMNGYLGEPDEEKNVFWTDGNGNRWIRSGDAGYMDEDGFLFLKGRIKRMIIRPDGHNVWPSQIEEVILQHPAVRQCVVIGIPSSDTQSGKIPTAFIVTRIGTIEDQSLLEEIHRFCGKHMPERDTAMAYLFVDEIPLTAVGKADTMALEEMIIRKNDENPADP